MSLINDALKRAKATQPKILSAADGPALRPVDAPRGPSARGNDFLLPALVLVILLLAGLLIWHWFRGGAAVPVHARSLVEPGGIASSQIVKKTVVTAESPVPPSSAVAVNFAMSAPATNAVASAEPSKPLPVVYKLQSLFFRPVNPSAVINGRMLGVGGGVAGARLVAIGRESATIVTADGRTNVLELSP